MNGVLETTFAVKLHLAQPGEGKSGQNSLDEFWGRELFFGSGVLKVPQIVEGADWGRRCLIRYQNERWNSIVNLMCNVC